MAAVKVGNFVRSADTAPIATINQTAPVYVTFAMPQRNLPDIRHALAAETANVEAIIPGETKRANGVVTMIENTVDPTTGMAMVRATMPNEDELLWPGTLVTAQMTLRDRGGGDGAVDGRAGEPDRAVRLCRQGRHGDRAAGQGGAHGRRRSR